MPGYPEYCKDEGKHVLIVEGKDDCHSIYQIAVQNQCETLFGIWAGGNDVLALQKFAGLLSTTPGKRPTVMGIVLDSDTDAAASTSGTDQRWSQVRDRLSGFGYKIPSKPLSKGTVIVGPGRLPKVGIWLMPNNQKAGMLEDFLLSLASGETVDYIRTCVRKARAVGHAEYKECHESKAVAHTYLAWQDEPGKPLGLAIKSRFFDANPQAAASFIAWLKKLFGTAN